jgi:hypothetical protein
MSSDQRSLRVSARARTISTNEVVETLTASRQHASDDDMARFRSADCHPSVSQCSRPHGPLHINACYLSSLTSDRACDTRSSRVERCSQDRCVSLDVRHTPSRSPNVVREGKRDQPRQFVGIRSSTRNPRVDRSHRAMFQTAPFASLLTHRMLSTRLPLSFAEVDSRARVGVTSPRSEDSSKGCASLFLLISSGSHRALMPACGTDPS